MVAADTVKGGHLCSERPQITLDIGCWQDNFSGQYTTLSYCCINLTSFQYIHEQSSPSLYMWLLAFYATKKDCIALYHNTAK